MFPFVFMNGNDDDNCQPVLMINIYMPVVYFCTIFWEKLNYESKQI